jgi:hypothetical protein
MRQDAERVLAHLHVVERGLSAAEPGSPEALLLNAEAERLRQQYMRLVADVEGHEQLRSDDFPEGGDVDPRL